MAQRAEDCGLTLKQVRVRPVRDAAERMRWDRLMNEHHYLGFRGMVGGGLRHVAEGPDGRWLALIGWAPGAFKVKVRDVWLGWAAEQQFRRLRLVANNTRFLVLPGCHIRNLASRALSLSTRRLSADMEARHGYPVLLAETFVDLKRFQGTCYRAANWMPLGMTRGYARTRGGWAAHGQPKQLLVRPLVADVPAALSGLEDPVALDAAEGDPPPPGRLRSLYDFLCEVPEYRRARGLRHRLATVLTVAVAGKLAGVRGATALGEFAARLDQRQLAAIRAFYSPSTKRFVAPSKSSLHRILAELDPDTLEQALRRWVASRQGPDAPLALDGKSAPSNRPGGPDPDRMFIAAVEHSSGVVHGQTASDSAGGEIDGVRQLIRELAPAGRTLTLDALHSCPNTARLIVEQGAEYVMPVKGNRPTLYDDIRAFDWDTAEKVHTLDKGHGRLEERSCATLVVDDLPDDIAALPGRRQAFCIVRRRTVLKTGKTSVETAYGLTSLGADQAGPSEILALNRGHWGIENRVHYVRDVTYDEDRSRIRNGRLPRNLACLTNAAIAIVRWNGQFRHQPEANRHYAARYDEALQEVLTAPA